VISTDIASVTDHPLLAFIANVTDHTPFAVTSNVIAHGHEIALADPARFDHKTASVILTVNDIRARTVP
jgi:hypothetical protein